MLLTAHGEQSALRFARMPDAAASTASQPNVRDDRETPLLSGRDNDNKATDLRWRSTAAGRGTLARRANRSAMLNQRCQEVDAPIASSAGDHDAVKVDQRGSES